MKSTELKVVIAGGGTGGHVQPAVAVAQALREKAPVQLHWIGSSTGFENQVARDLDIPFTSIPTGKLRRYFSLQTPVDAFRIPLGVFQAIRRLRTLMPDVVFGTGGFVSVPSIIAARVLGIPCLTHEQTAIAGLANKINARFCDVTAVSYKESGPALEGYRSKLVLTGNPVRQAMLRGDVESCFRRFGLRPELPLIYVTGGTLGAQALNHVVRDAIPDMLESVQVLHQCGPAAKNGDYPELVRIREQMPERLQDRYIIQEFLQDELPDVFAASALVIGRAGASTVAELTALGKPSILIPLPGAGGDEQTRNAEVLMKAGGAVLIQQRDLTQERLTAEVNRIVTEPGALDAMANGARSVYQPGADQRLADELLLLAGRPDLV